MLLWGTAAAIPIVMHLLNRRRQQTVNWAAMRLLLQVIEKQSRRIRIEQLILLILRTLIFVNARVSARTPLFPTTAKWRIGCRTATPRHLIFVIDNSYSMGYRDDRGTRFSAAQNARNRIRKSFGSW